jgi:hypothetical protein
MRACHLIQELDGGDEDDDDDGGGGGGGQGLTLVHISAQLEPFSWDRGCA